MVDISVIVPVYNTKKYLGDCVESILAQTIRSIEIILVDDGSTDGSLELAHKYAERDSRVKVISGGHSNAGACRNRGMAVATGEYLAFLDSDDVFSPWLFETLLRGARVYDADVVICKYFCWFESDGAPQFIRATQPKWRDVTMRPTDGRGFCGIWSGPWDKIYRRSMVEKFQLRFLEQQVCNDLTFVFLALSVSEKVIATSEAMVAYRMRSGSLQAIKSKAPRAFLNAIRVYCQECQRRAIFELKPHVRSSIAYFFMSSVVYDLFTQTTVCGYREEYEGVRKLEEEERFLECCCSKEDESDRFIRRYQRIIANGLVERIRSILECGLISVFGSRARVNGTKAIAYQFARGMVLLVFEPIFMIRIVSRLISKNMRQLWSSRTGQS